MPLTILTARFGGVQGRVDQRSERDLRKPEIDRISVTGGSIGPAGPLSQGTHAAAQLAFAASAILWLQPEIASQPALITEQARRGPALPVGCDL